MSCLVCRRVPLVPVFTFNEHRALAQARGPALDSVQDWARRRIGFVPVVPIGRGIFQYSFGAVPHRLPLTVVGASSVQPAYRHSAAEPAALPQPISDRHSSRGRPIRGPRTGLPCNLRCIRLMSQGFELNGLTK